MRFLTKGLKLIVFPFLSLILVSLISLYSMGYLETVSHKNGSTKISLTTALQNGTDMIAQIRNIASVPSEREKMLESFSFESDELKNDSGSKKKYLNAKIEITSENSVRGMIEENCIFDELTKEISSSHVKFNFVGCSDDAERNNVNIKLINLTNGYQAQIFSFRNKKISSDYIQLQHGQNELLFQISSSDGQKRSQKIKINRLQ